MSARAGRTGFSSLAMLAGELPARVITQVLAPT